jgi:hypothetical protein
MKVPLFFCRFRVWGAYPTSDGVETPRPVISNQSGEVIRRDGILSGEVVSRKSDHRSRAQQWARVKSGMGSLVGFFSRLLQAHLLGPTRLFFNFDGSAAGRHEPVFPLNDGRNRGLAISPQAAGVAWTVRKSSAVDSTAGNRLKAAPAREAGAVFCPICFWCLVEQGKGLPIGIVTLSDCPRHRSTEGRAKVHGL